MPVIKRLEDDVADAPRRENVTLRQYAEVGAHLRYFPKERAAHVLERLGVERARWDAARAAWSSAIDEDVAQEDPKLAVAWREHFEEASDRLRREAPTLDAGAVDAPPASAKPEVAVPSYQLEVEPPAPSYRLGSAAAPAQPTFGLAAPPKATSGARPPPPMETVVDRLSPFGPPPPPPLPFAPPRAESPLAVPDRPAESARAPRHEVPDENETALIPATFLTPSALPFPGKQAPLTLERYAALRAELADKPIAAKETLARYGIHDEQAHRMVDLDFAQRFHKDTAQEAQFWTLVARYADYFKLHR